MIAISIPEERWFSAAESLPTLRGLADWVRSTPMVVRGRKRVLADLERMEQISSAQRARESSGIWRSTFDFAIYVEPTGKLFRQSWSVA